MTTERERLERLLGGAPLNALRTRLRRHFALDRPADALVLTRLAPEERQALEGLLGLRARSASSLRLSLSELDAVLSRAGLASSLREALETLDGPIPNLPAERARKEQAWDELFAASSSPALTTLFAQSAGRGLVKRLARGQVHAARALLDRATLVLARLPAPGIPRSQLAAEVLGDAHGLDAGRPVATLVMAALRAEDEAERETWARAGVLVNELAAPTLVLNLDAARDTPLGAVLREAHEHGLPVHLSLRNLLRAPPRWLLAGRDVFVCENANVVAAAADQLGNACAPLVCTDGMPSASQRILLTQLARHGARLHYHGDFDWPGVRIANYVMRAFGAMAWRMGVSDYAGRSGRSLKGAPVEACWEPALAGAMQAGGYALEEEAVMAGLCQDLAAKP